MTEKVPMFVFMSPSQEQSRQMRDDCLDEPKWFAYPIKKAGFDLHFKPRPRAGLSRLRELLRTSKLLCALVFTVGEIEAIACTLWGHRLRICSLFQWKALENLPLHKRICYRKILDRSRVIAVYDQVSEHYIRKIYPRKHILRIGLFADTEFFQPSDNSGPKEDYVVCPGSNFRLEDTVVKIAEQIPLKVVRYSNEPAVRRYYDRHPNSRVDFRYNIPYSELRSLMDKARFILNVADDTQVPAGIYAFCQGLAMNQIVVTPNMHSSAGYELPGGEKPYITIDDPFDVNKWIAAAKAIIEGKAAFTGRPRELAQRFCSLEKSTDDWKRVKDLLLDTPHPNVCPTKHRSHVDHHLDSGSDANTKYDPEVSEGI